MSCFVILCASTTDCDAMATDNAEVSTLSATRTAIHWPVTAARTADRCASPWRSLGAAPVWRPFSTAGALSYVRAYVRATTSRGNLRGFDVALGLTVVGWQVYRLSCQHNFKRIGQIEMSRFFYRGTHRAADSRRNNYRLFELMMTFGAL